ncbi:hypothetical protein SAMN05444166_1759 [Singulisphaera sp. GP187]|uniref:hypothetical protein n=1 Tax=Singulisphaera sp. GP187 TaxID=1882752 RepID=UPI000929F49D|nr:hypothetical protein [Singulisphaera sp. GP187]SIN95251.1 hypothetical protein SAMN05444166_1759 [Singulisphaera sp. GP187]
MSGPIIRKYGFPNFENIFGARPLEHGVDEQGQAEAATPATSDSKSEKAKAKPAPKSKKSS